jgi:hypothetical protein
MLNASQIECHIILALWNATESGYRSAFQRNGYFKVVQLYYQNKRAVSQNEKTRRSVMRVGLLITGFDIQKNVKKKGCVRNFVQNVNYTLLLVKNTSHDKAPSSSTSMQAYRHRPPAVYDLLAHCHIFVRLFTISISPLQSGCENPGLFSSRIRFR